MNDLTWTDAVYIAAAALFAGTIPINFFLWRGRQTIAWIRPGSPEFDERMAQWDRTFGPRRVILMLGLDAALAPEAA